MVREKEAAAGRAVNVGTGKQTSITELAEELACRYGKDNELSPEVTEEFRSGDIRHSYGDAPRAAERLEFEAEVSLKEGIEELESWGLESEATDNTDAAYSEMEEKGLIRGLIHQHV